MKRFVIILFLLMIPLTMAGNIEYQINDKDTIVDISYFGDEFFSIEFPKEKNVLEFDEISKIKYTTNSFVEKSGSDYFFITKNDFHLNSSVKVILPTGAILDSKYFVFPRGYETTTNGQNIIISWSNIQEKEILIPYIFPSKFNIWPIILSLILGLLLLFIIMKNYNKKNDGYTKNLFGDEKKIIKYLVIKKECWTKEIVRDLGISKVKLSRRLRSLEQKGLITKAPHGNENRIVLKK